MDVVEAAGSGIVATQCLHVYFFFLLPVKIRGLVYSGKFPDPVLCSLGCNGSLLRIGRFRWGGRRPRRYYPNYRFVLRFLLVWRFLLGFYFCFAVFSFPLVPMSPGYLFSRLLGANRPTSLPSLSTAFSDLSF